MSTLIHIPGYRIQNNNDFDISSFLTSPPQSFTLGPQGIERTEAEWIVEIVENLNVGQQTALTNQLLNALDEITYEVI